MVVHYQYARSAMSTENIHPVPHCWSIEPAEVNQFNVLGDGTNVPTRSWLIVRILGWNDGRSNLSLPHAARVLGSCTYVADIYTNPTEASAHYEALQQATTRIRSTDVLDLQMRVAQFTSSPWIQRSKLKQPQSRVHLTPGLSSDPSKSAPGVLPLGTLLPTPGRRSCKGVQLHSASPAQSTPTGSSSGARRSGSEVILERRLSLS
jgi:hypothetical protein